MYFVTKTFIILEIENERFKKFKLYKAFSPNDIMLNLS